MVDFKKRLKNKSIPKKTNPIEVYESLDRTSEAGPLRPSQEKILTEWFSKRKDARDNIIKLHTGEGKTLIGLLILQSKINSGDGLGLYICPNKYLADQVRADAIKFGVPYVEIGEDNQIPEDFSSGTKILITHVQKLFNGKTIFGIGSKSHSVGTIILDDSHACIESIKSSVTIKVDRSHPLYTSALSLFADSIRDQGEGSFLEIESGDYNTMLPIPYWSWIDKKTEIATAIMENKEDSGIKYAWPVIKDLIPKCQAFISGSFLEISPCLTPIEQFGSFSKAKCRILMSATTQDDAFFIKGFGFDIESVRLPLTNKELKWSGEKMIILPSLINDDLDRDAIVNIFAKPSEKRNVGVVALTPSFTKNNQYEKLGAIIANTGNIYNLVNQLKSGDRTNTIVFANRYDGIDLPDAACRVLILDSKPYFDSLLDKYEENCRPNSDSINIRIAQKVEQGLGRSVRGEKDYSAILIIGGDLVKFIKSSTTSKYFSAQTRKQIQIGIKAAEFAKEDAEEAADQDSSTVIRKLIQQILAREEGWKEFYNEEMESIDLEDQSTSVHELLKKEYEAEKFFTSGDYEKACEITQKLCDQFTNSPEEKGWYLQSLARYKYEISKTESNKLQKSAFQCNSQLLKPKDGINYKRVEFINQNRIHRIKQWIGQHNTYADMMISIDGILQDLSFGMPAEKFESALKTIGDALGFISQRPDKEIKKGPDNLWCGVNNQYLMFECKSEVEDTRSEINKYEAAQMNSHCAWFDSEYPEQKCKRILIIPTKKLSYHGDFSHDVEIMRKGTLRVFKNNIKSFFKEFSSYVISEISEEKVQELIRTHKLDIQDVTSTYTERYTTSSNK